MLSKVYFKKFLLQNLRDLPIPKIEHQENKFFHYEIVKLVDTMLQLQQQKQNATLATEQEQLTQRIQYTDNTINQRVYTLYGLTEDEIKMVEGGVIQNYFFEPGCRIYMRLYLRRTLILW